MEEKIAQVFMNNNCTIHTSQSSFSGQTAPVMEWTVSKATIFGMLTSTLFNNSSKCLGSLWRKICLGTPEFRIPCIMDA